MERLSKRIQLTFESHFCEYDVRDFSVTFRFCSFLANFSRIWFCISSRLVLPIIDYLLKPIEKEDLDRAVQRCRTAAGITDMSALLSTFASPQRQPDYRQKFMIRLNDKILPVSVNDIAYFLSEDKVTWMFTSDGSKYVLDQSLDILASQLDPSRFFRISRGCIIASSAVRSIIKLQGGRLRINAHPPYEPEIIVSRSRSDDFLQWMENSVN